MLPVEACRRNSGDKELRTIGVGTSIGHAQDARNVVDHREVLVGKFCTVDTLAAASVGLGEVSTLTHKIGNDTMEDRTLKVQRLARVAFTFLARAQSAKVFSCSGNIVSKETHRDSTNIVVVDSDVEVHLVSDFCVGSTFLILLEWRRGLGGSRI